MPVFDPAGGELAGVCPRDPESIAAAAQAADSMAIGTTIESLRAADSSPWLAQKDGAAGSDRA